jgi:4a-hydroxytetrahydrobiopterin dehydratase
MTASNLAERHGKSCEFGVEPFNAVGTGELLTSLHPDWSIAEDGREISRNYHFGNYYRNVAFGNALAWIAHGEDHHPDIEVGYNRCHASYSTHATGGLSESDFICAARIDALLPATE